MTRYETEQGKLLFTDAVDYGALFEIGSTVSDNGIRYMIMDAWRINGGDQIVTVREILGTIDE